MNSRKTTALWLVRHGQTDWNVEGRYTGHTDLPLNAAGLEQARRLAEKLAGHEFTAVYTSDLLRARQTAEIIAFRLGVPVYADPRLREVHQGEWEGMLFSTIVAEYEAELARWHNDPAVARPPGGESVGELAERVWACAGDIAHSHPGEAVVVVSHGLSIATLLVKARGLPLTQVYNQIPPNSQPVEVDWGDEKQN